MGLVPKEGIEVRPGQTVHLRTSTHEHRGAQSTVHSPLLEIPVTYSSLSRDLRVGARVLINDGLIELVTERIMDDLVECTVLAGGMITSHKGINLPGTPVSAPTLTEKDREDIRFGAETWPSQDAGHNDKRGEEAYVEFELWFRVYDVQYPLVVTDGFIDEDVWGDESEVIECRPPDESSSS